MDKLRSIWEAEATAACCAQLMGQKIRSSKTQNRFFIHNEYADSCQSLVSFSRETPLYDNSERVFEMQCVIINYERSTAGELSDY